MSIMKRGRFWALGAATSMVGALAACSGGGDGSQVTASDATSQATVAIAMFNLQGQPAGFCSGTLIGATTVLTAGHCVAGNASWQISAPNSGVAGTVNGFRGVTYDWQEFGSNKSHPAHNDVALIYLDKPITLSAYPKLALSSAADGTVLTRFRRADVKSATTSIKALSGAAYHGLSRGFANAYTTDLAEGEDVDTGGALMDTATNTIYGVISGKGLTSGSLYASRVDTGFRWAADKLSCHSAKTSVTSQSLDVLCKTDAGAKKPPSGSGSTGSNGGTKGGTNGGSTGTNGGTSGGGNSTNKDCDVEVPGGLFGFGSGAAITVGSDGTIYFPGGSYGPGGYTSGVTPPNGGTSGGTGGTNGGTHDGTHDGTNGSYGPGTVGSGTTPPNGGTNGGTNGSYGPSGGTVPGGGGCWGLCPGLEGPYGNHGNGVTPPNGGTAGGTNGSYGPGSTNGTTPPTGGTNGGASASGNSNGTTPPNGSTNGNGSYGAGATGTTDGACLAGPNCGGCTGLATCSDDTFDYGGGVGSGDNTNGGQVPIK